MQDPQSIPETDVVKVTRNLLTDLFGSQMEASRKLHMHERTVRWWCYEGAPPHILHTLDRLRRKEISLRWARVLMRSKRTRRFKKGNGNPPA